MVYVASFVLKIYISKMKEGKKKGGKNEVELEKETCIPPSN